MGEGEPISGQARPSGLTIAGADIPPPIRAAGAVPIIVTAMMGTADQRHFDALRAAHFPPERNQLRAHITLFHQLPPSCLGELGGLIKTLVADAQPPAMIGAPYSLGSGVAYRIDSPELLGVRERIAEWFAGSLSAQDQGVPRLHITVQNKVEPAAAKALLSELIREFEPRPLCIAGIAAHHYLGGPWQTAFERKFRR